VRRWLRLLAVSAVLVASPAVAGEIGSEDAPGHNETGEGHGFDAKKFAFQMANFAVLLFILIKFGGGALNKALAARHVQLKKDIEESAQARQAAEKRLAEQELRLTNLAAEVSRLRASIKEEADKEQARLLAVAEEKSARIQDDARFLMEQQVKEAERRFREEVATAAVRIAEEVVKRSVRADDESRLAQSFVADLERPPAPGRS
jgi:F-type H+-transporting ATPase subunit b